ncbi:gliding motility protein GldN [Flexithrix dorotheae]|uniref:type IX secretion system ring protein PorN/GldN n=1 Tax=Flexithrix dorotheae TaxID=70993 RepID=UPI00037B266E|nr:gliding motility protein GldN [Flexithrix dorotheae]
MIGVKKTLTVLVIAILTLPSVTAQLARNNQPQEEQYNPNSIRPVRKDDIMFKKSLWYRLDLRTKINYPMFSENNEISRLLIDAVKNDIVKPFKNDSLQTRMDKRDFLERLRIPQYEPEEEIVGFDNDDAWGEPVQEVELGPEEYLPRQLYVIELKKDIVFDKKESRMKDDIQAITIIIPAEQTPTGLDKVLASFSYKELVEHVFRNNPNALWFNPQNSAAHLNLEDAFTLRLPHGQLVKYENPKNSMIVDLYGGGKRALIESEKAIMQLMEYEALLWEY